MKVDPVRSERGAALLLVIVLSTIALIIMTTVLYMIMMGTGITGSEKRYRTAHEAALGGADIIRAVIQSQTALAIPGVSMAFQASFANKLAATDFSLLPADQVSLTIDPTNANTYDLWVDLGVPAYRVYIKMVQKKPGNTQKGYKNVRVKTGVVPADPGMGQVLNTYYTFEILAQQRENPRERVRMQLVHIF